jgi:hypothetical protein
VVLALCIVACTPRPLRIVDVSPSEAAELSEIYHDRVMVLGVRRPDGSKVERTGALVDDGRALITRRNQKLAIDGDDMIHLRIDYVDGDRNVRGGGIVHKGTDSELVSSGAILAVLGALVLAGSIAGASTQCPPEGEWGRALCGAAFGWLGFASVATLLTGVGLAIRGASPTNFTLSF